MAETTNSTQKKMSIRHRIIRICKWLLVIFLLLFASNWICSAVYARRNQKIVRDFYDQVGASSLSAWVGDLGADPVSGNAWYLYMASLTCISEDTREAHDTHDGDADLELRPGARSRREAELDRAHRLIEEARSLPRSISIVNFTHPIKHELLQLLRRLGSYTRVALASAREHRKAGEFERARERLVDAFHVSQGVLGQPVLASHLVTIGTLLQIETEIVATLPDLSDADLATLDELLEGVNLRQAMKEAMTGEVFFGLRTWNLGSQAAMLDIGYPRCLFEIDRSYYLDRMIPIALDPESEEAIENFRRPVPGYAILSRMVIRGLDYVFDVQRAARVCLDLTREALQREAKRRRGEEFDYPSPNEHITIEKTKNGVRLYSPLLRAFGDPKKALEATIGGRS